MRASIFSIYFNNVVQEVIEAQRRCVRSLMPEGWNFHQILHIPGQGDNFPHAHALEKCIDMSENDTIIFLDIDCIPLDEKALHFLAECVAKHNGQGLAGAIQRANHIANDRHLYIGPFCMAFSKKYYKELGSPSFVETTRGDVGEELTYRWTEKSGFLSTAGSNPHKYSSNIHFMWPFSCEKPAWDLDFGWRFGFGTTYGAAGIGKELFYHTFNARNPEMQRVFINKCNSITNLERITA